MLAICRNAGFLVNARCKERRLGVHGLIGFPSLAKWVC